MTVLIVDDDDWMRRRLQKLLPAETRTSSTLAQGLLDAADWQPAVILLDVHFAESFRTGIDAIPEFKRACSRAEVVVMTGCYEEWLARLAIAAGAFSCVGKADEKRLVSNVLLARSQVRKPLIHSGRVH